MSWHRSELALRLGLSDERRDAEIRPAFGTSGHTGKPSPKRLATPAAVDGLRALSIPPRVCLSPVWCAQVVIRDTYVQFQQLTPGTVAQERGFVLSFSC